MKSLTEGMFANVNYTRNPWDGKYGTPGTSSISGISNPINYNTPSNSNLITVDHCANMHGWQQHLSGMLGQDRDIYILSQPGSGKTLPVICYWVNNLLQISTSQTPDNQNLLKLITEPEKVPQVLWLVPIKNLSANIAQEMTERFVDIITQILNKTCSVIPNTQNLLFNNAYLDIKTIINSMSKFGAGQSRGLLLSMIDNNNQVEGNQVAEFKTNLGILIQNYVIHALVGRIEDGLNTVKIGNTSELKPFIISIYESSKHVIKNMNDLRLIVFDEAQRIQGGDIADDTRAAQIGDNIHSVLFHENGRKAKIVMLSGSTSPATAKNVIQYFNMAYKRKFNDIPYQTPDTVTNPSDIRVFPMANLNDQYTQLRIINTALAGGNLRKGGIVFVIFGKDRINKLIDKLAPTEKGFINPGRNLSQSKGSLYSKSDIHSITSPGDINDIDDERLRRAASNGLGYLYRPEDITNLKRQHDTTIVQRLFKDGVIRVLFATDAVREGINITCNEMYIPSTLLPPDNREMDAGSLAQLINRVGRKEGKYATIYTDPKFVSNITKALSNDPSRFGEQPFTLPGSWITKTGSSPKVESMLNYGVNVSADVAVSIGRGIIKVFF